MKTIAVIPVDLDTTPIGTRSRLADSLGGEPLLVRTINRLAQCRRIDQMIISVPAPQSDRVATLVGGTPLQLCVDSMGPAPYRRLVTAARKWSLDGWRGGLGGCCAFDEYMNTPVLAQIVKAVAADALVVVPPGAALLDPVLTDAMIEHYATVADQMRMTFAQTPPGLAPIVCQAALITELAAHCAPPGWTMSYKPHEPQPDLALKACCYQVDQPIRHAAGRLTADTSRSWNRMEAILNDGVELTADRIGQWLLQRSDEAADDWPREVEIELCTQDPLSRSLVRPRGPLVPDRGYIQPELIEKLADELTQKNDDVLIVCGGFGDPVLHPGFSAIIATLRERGVYGICVYTTGQQLPDETIATLIEHEVDVLVVQLDAHSADTYARINNGDLGVPLNATERVRAARVQANQPAPIIVPQLVKCRENLHEIDAFYDEWIKRNGCALIAGHSRFGDLLPDRSVLDQAPPSRHACLRLRDRCMMLADGTVVACDQDATGQQVLGHLGKQTLKEIWSGPAAQALRADHRRGELSQHPLCKTCSQWHRP